MNRSELGLTLAEIIVAFGLAAVLVLTVLAVTTSSLRANRKAVLSTTASLVADQQLERALYSANENIPPGSKVRFWDQEHTAVPFAEGEVKVGSDTFEFKIFAQTVQDQSTGNPLGTSTEPDNRVKKVDAVVSWWDGGEQRQGYGRLSTRATKLLVEDR